MARIVWTRNLFEKHYYFNLLNCLYTYLIKFQAPKNLKSVSSYTGYAKVRFVLNYAPIGTGRQVFILQESVFKVSQINLTH